MIGSIVHSGLVKDNAILINIFRKEKTKGCTEENN